MTSETKSENIIAHYKKLRTSVIQMMDAPEEKQYDILRRELPHVKLVQVIHVIDEQSAEKAIGQVQPFGPDLCSSVRTNGSLDEKKLADFFNAVNG